MATHIMTGARGYVGKYPTRELLDRRGDATVSLLGATRNFIDVRDGAIALAVIGERGICGEADNVSSRDEMPIAGLLDRMMQLSGLSGAVTEEASLRSVIDVPHHFGDVTRLRELGFAPQHRIDERLRNLLAERQPPTALGRG